MDIFEDITAFSVFVTSVVVISSCLIFWAWFKDYSPKRGGAQDVFEIQVLGQGCETEETLREWKGCIKNPDHPGFIPVPKFRIQDLPQEFQTRNWYLFIKCLAGLTVRLRVSSVSPNRPKSGPFSLKLGEDYHCGSGFIGGFKEADGLCPCRQCEKSPHPSKRWWLLMITTAAHVVYDDDEVRHTTVDLFYDSDAAMHDNRVRRLRGYKLKGASDGIDTCLFYCAICDANLASLIEEKRAHVTELCRNLKENHRENPISEKPAKAILISHPHARPKVITVGDLTNATRVKHDEEKSEYYAYEMYACGYTTGSCPGSSGGHLIWLGDSRIGENVHGWWFGTHCNSEKKGVNHGARICIRRHRAMFWRRRESSDLTLGDLSSRELKGL